MVGIDWGAVGTITCEDENHDSEEATKVKGALEAEVKKVKGLLDVGGSASTDFTDKSTGRKFTYYRETFLHPSREPWSRPGRCLQPWLDTTRVREFQSPSA